MGVCIPMLHHILLMGLEIVHEMLVTYSHLTHLTACENLTLTAVKASDLTLIMFQILNK
jgi:hypothetical protein